MKRKIIQGRLQGNERGYAFLIPNDEEEDYFIPHGDLRGAMHKDEVLAETTSGSGERTTARVLKILSRGVSELVGTYFTCRTGGFVVPDDRKYFNDVFIPFGKGLRAKAGDKVVCKVLSYPKGKNPEGIVSKILGRQFDKKTELKSILYTYGLNDKFPSAVIKELKELAEPEKDSILEDRDDYRDLITFTIDGEDAKDFDDAVSISKDSFGDFKLGVHIADVSHYVKEGGEIDKEAFSRATSVYFPESVIPMLPEKLCNDLCSLVEGKDRLTLSCVMDVSKDGRVKSYKISPSVIRSKARLTYTAVQRVIDGDKKERKKLGVISDSILLMSELADVLIRNREKQGSIDLDVKESLIRVDKKGEIIIQPAKRDKAHRLIEEFMILTNVTVAEYMYYTENPFIYRVHDKPALEKLESFYALLKGLGVKVKKKKDGSLVVYEVKKRVVVNLIERK